MTEKECQECGKKTNELYTLNLPLPENPKIIEPHTVCSECYKKFDNLFKETVKFIRDMQAKSQRKMFDDNGSATSLK